jgi:hypothetical protein
MITLASYFGSAYLINLPERLDRLKSAEKELARIGWHFGQDCVQVLPARRFTHSGGFPSAGVRGAFYSHLDCLRRAAHEDRGSVLILEDDVSFSASLKLVTPFLISRLDTARWDLIYFGHDGTGSIPFAARNLNPEQLNLVPFSADIQCVHFYAVNTRIFSRLIRHLETVALGKEGDQETGPMPIDGALNIFRRLNPGIVTLIATPKLGRQRPSRSDITPRKFDQIRLLRPITAVIRDLKHRLRLWHS